LEYHQIVSKTGAKQAKTEQIQKIEIVAILLLAKGFSGIFYLIANRRPSFSRPPPISLSAISPNLPARPSVLLLLLLLSVDLAPSGTRLNTGDSFKSRTDVDN
jgi:hypothetical protein